MDLSPISKFSVFWWLPSDSSRLSRYVTKRDVSIERFSEQHVRLSLTPLDPRDDELELILRFLDEKWFVNSSSFEDGSENYPIAFAATTDGAVWTDAGGDELMVIRGSIG